MLITDAHDFVSTETMSWPQQKFIIRVFITPALTDCIVQ